MNAATLSTRAGAETVLKTDTGHSVVVRAWRGQGSYAQVYQGTYGAGGRFCAVKLAKPDVPDARERLERERVVLGGLRHPRVVGLLDTGRHHGTPYLVLEWLEGDALLDLVNARRRLPLKQSLEILENAADGLAYIHSQGFVHGDVRPQNVLVVPRSGAVLTDPGGMPGADFTDDVRAVGSLLYHMLTGEDPQRGPVRLTAAAGYNRAAVQLWERTQARPQPSAAELLAEVHRLLRSL